MDQELLQTSSKNVLPCLFFRHLVLPCLVRSYCHIRNTYKVQTRNAYRILEGKSFGRRTHAFNGNACVCVCTRAQQ